jgi:vancomycin resistance protein YoaR
VDKLLEKLKQQMELRDIALDEGKTTKGLDKGITKMNRNVEDLRDNITNHEQTIMTNESEMKTIEERWSAHFEENLTDVRIVSVSSVGYLKPIRSLCSKLLLTSAPTSMFLFLMVLTTSSLSIQTKL